MSTKPPVDLDDLIAFDEDGNPVDLHTASADELVGYGWLAMASNDLPSARMLFYAALDLDPACNDAREGLLEAHKGASWLCRTIQRAGLRIVDLASRRGKRSLFVPVILFGGLPSLLLSLIRKVPQHATPLWIVLLTYLGLLVVIQLADYGATLRLWFDARFRSLLSAGAATAALPGTISLLTSVACVLLYSHVDHIAILTLAMVFFFLPALLDAAFESRAGLPRMLMFTYTLVVVACGIGSAAVIYTTVEGRDWNEPLGATAGRLFLAFIVGVFAVRFVAGAASHLPAAKLHIDRNG